MIWSNIFKFLEFDFIFNGATNSCRKNSFKEDGPARRSLPSLMALEFFLK